MSRFPLAVTAFVLLAACLLVGCREDVVRPCDLWTASAVVSGRVTHSAGAAIADAAVKVELALRGRCDDADDWVHAQQVTTDTSGNYSVGLEIGNASGIRCVRVIEVKSGTSVQGEVDFVGGCTGTGPPGRLKLDLVIP